MRIHSIEQNDGITAYICCYYKQHFLPERLTQHEQQEMEAKEQ